MTCIFGQISFALADRQQLGHPFPCAGGTHSHTYAGYVCQFCLKLLHSCQQHPEYLCLKTYQQTSLNFTMFGWSVSNHEQFLVALYFLGGFCLHPLQRPSSCASRVWSWYIGDNDGGFLQCPIPFQMKVSDQYLCKFLVLLPFYLLNYCFFSFHWKNNVELVIEIQSRYSIVTYEYPLQHVPSL